MLTRARREQTWFGHKHLDLLLPHSLKNLTLAVSVYAAAFGGLADALHEEDNSGHLETAFATGLTVGAFTWGILVDVIGRRWAFNLTLLITATFGLLIGAPSSYTGVCILAAFTGACSLTILHDERQPESVEQVLDWVEIYR